MSNLADLSAVELIQKYKARSLSPVEVTEAVIERVIRLEPKLCAMYAFEPDGARKMAKASEERWVKGAPAGPIDGVPISIKENIATKGVPVPLGTAATDLAPAAADAPPAARIRESGGVILGKTTMPDFGMLSSGLSSFHQIARNPWDLSKNPGGSSAGAGAAAAAGYGPLHVGTDIGGSVRLPASWCGIVALKPSLGRIPVDPPYVGRVAGPMTRTVADTALLMSVLYRPDARDHMSLPFQEIDWGKLDRDPKGLKIGLLLEAAGMPLDQEVKAAVEAAAKGFEAAGASIIPMKPFFTLAMLDGADDFWRARSMSDILNLSPEKRQKILPYIAAWAHKGAQLSGVDVVRGFGQVMAMRAAAHNAIQGLDFILSPTAPVPSFPAEWPGPTNNVERPLDHIGFTVPANMSEQPAVSVNCAWTNSGLPIGLQITGHRFDDLSTLQMARAWEKIRPPQRPWPTF